MPRLPERLVQRPSKLTANCALMATADHVLASSNTGRSDRGGLGHGRTTDSEVGENQVQR
jgi:hypothetical protein